MAERARGLETGLFMPEVLSSIKLFRVGLVATLHFAVHPGGMWRCEMLRSERCQVN
jgi:hypothetical protein